MSHKVLLLLTIACSVICFDQASKLFVVTELQPTESLPVFNNFFHFTYVRNYGAAFGLFSVAPESIREIFFLALPPLALLFILILLRATPEKDKVQLVGLSLVFGGAIGNYLDRLRFGYVVDFLDFHVYSFYAWPAFNIADMAIVVGVSALLVGVFKEYAVSE